MNNTIGTYISHYDINDSRYIVHFLYNTARRYNSILTLTTLLKVEGLMNNAIGTHTGISHNDISSSRYCSFFSQHCT